MTIEFPLNKCVYYKGNVNYAECKLYDFRKECAGDSCLIFKLQGDLCNYKNKNNELMDSYSNLSDSYKSLEDSHDKLLGTFVKSHVDIIDSVIKGNETFTGMPFVKFKINGRDLNSLFSIRNKDIFKDFKGNKEIKFFENKIPDGE